MGLIKTAKKAIAKVKAYNDPYDMSTKEARELRAKKDYEYAKTEKQPHTEKMKELDDYYHNKHLTAIQMAQLVEDKGWTFTPPVLPDPFIQVEEAIDTNVPQFEFKGRDANTDPEKAKERQKVVEYICYNNRLAILTQENERPLNKYGNAFFKVSFDGSIDVPGAVGDIVIGNPGPQNIFPDPASYDIEGCEFFPYAYRMSRRAAAREYAKELKKLGMTINDIAADGNHGDTEIFNDRDRSINDDTVQIVEHWYRNDDGDPAFTTQINNIEVRHVPKYWINTASSGNKMYPFIRYCKIPKEQSFWGMGVIEPIMDLVDASDREFMNAILNDAFMANDITIVEDQALADGQQMTATPGAVIMVKPNKISAVRRLSGVSQNSNALAMINFIHEKIQETTGNFDSANGKEPVRVTTASGIAQLNEKAQARKVMQKADRLQGFNKLYELIDWTALEFFNTDRIISINGKDEKDQQPPITFNSTNHQQTDLQTQEAYFPRLDSEITSGEGVQHSVSFTLSATKELSEMPINPQNFKIVMAYVDLLDLPNKQDIKDSLEQQFASPPPPPEDKQNISMAYKDLPMTGQIQAAQKAGIQLQPQDFQVMPGMPNTMPQQGAQMPLEQGADPMQGNAPQQEQDPLAEFPEPIRRLLEQMDPQHLQTFLQQPHEKQHEILNQIAGGSQ